MSRSRRRSEQNKHKMKKSKRTSADDDTGHLRRHGRLLKRYEELPDEAYRYFLQHQSDPSEW